MFLYEMKWKVVVLEEVGEKIKFNVDRLPIRADVIASKEQGSYSINFELLGDKREKVYTQACESRFTVD